MLLIGSRAGKINFPEYRHPNDYDFIATRAEADDFLSKFRHEIKPSHPKKIKAKVEFKGRKKSFELEIAEEIPSSQEIYNCSSNFEHYDSDLGISYKVASPKNLFLLKKSHIVFNIHWKKNIIDYLFLKARVSESTFDTKWHEIYNLRFNEVKDRLKYKERSFDVSNSDFFKVSERFVKRLLPHDNIHYATCFFDEPLFRRVKDDLDKAEMSEDKVNALSHDLKIKLIQEEIMALSIERFVLPAIKNKTAYDYHTFFVDTAASMVYNYLPMFLRHFAVDNFLEIVKLDFNYVDKFFSNVKGLDLNLLNQ